MRPVLVLPSLLSADFGRLADQLAWCRSQGAQRLHVDIMDGHFVPNLTIGPFIVEFIRRATDLHLDVHLMLSRPLDFVTAFRSAGADAISIHAEAVGPRTILEALASVRATGARVGLAFNPDTDAALWHTALAQVDLAMYMTVYPGYGGQRFIEAVRPRIRALRAAFPSLDLQVDGGINRETVPLVTADGANLLVAGNGFFKDADPAGFLAWAQRQTCP